MKKLVAVLAVLITTQACAADWELVASNANSKVFIDRSSIAFQDGGTVKVWQLSNFMEPQFLRSKAYKSELALVAYSCKNHTHTAKHLSFFTKENRRGRAIFSSPMPPETRDILPESIAEGVFKSVCK